MAGSNATQTNPTSIKLEQFGGMLPAWDDSLLAENQAALSQNCYLFSGALEGWRTPKLLYTLLNSGAKSVYRLPRTAENIANATIYILALPLAGDTVKLGEETYTFKVAVVDAYDVKIGATTADAATNLFQAFTLDNGTNANVGTNYGVGCVANPAINQTSPTTTNVLATDTPRILVYAPSSGAAYNATALATSAAARAEWRYSNIATTTLQGGTNISFDASITSDSIWLEFTDPDTDVMRSPVVDDQYERYYFASPSLAPRYNTRARLEAGDNYWLLGVPAPGCSPGVTVEGGGDDVEAGFPDSITTNTHALVANIIYLVPVTPEAALRLNDVTMMPSVTDATADIVAVLYGDLNGTPHEVINVGVPVTGVTSGTEVSSLFINPTGLLQNVTYWIGFAIDDASTWLRANDTGTTGVTSSNTYSNGPPAVINSLVTGQPELNVWGNCTSTALQEARAYVYTYLSEYDEESPPSPATTVTGWSNGTWTVTLNTPPPDQMGVTRNLTDLRIYRTITSTAGATTYFHVVDLPIATAEYVDTISDDVVATEYLLQSQLWTPPPENLLGIMSMPNGMTVGFRTNEIWFSEPYRPHAWPATYVLNTEYPIVGLGVTGNTVVACTSGAPYVASGVAPGAMTATRIQRSEPCHSRGSILGTNDGVYYTSPNGLILVTQYGQVTNTSEGWITRQRWQVLTPQKNIRAVALASSYFALGTVRSGDTSVAQQGFTIELSDDNKGFTIWPQPGGHRLGFNKLSGPNGLDVDNVSIDPWSSVCIVVQGGAVYYYDFTDAAPVPQTYIWRSKIFQQKSKKNYQAMRVWFSVPPGVTSLNATRMENDTDDPVWEASLPADRYGILRVYADDVLVTAREIRVSQEILRILDGFKAESWQWEIEARVLITGLQLGTSIKALAQI